MLHSILAIDLTTKHRLLLHFRHKCVQLRALAHIMAVQVCNSVFASREHFMTTVFSQVGSFAVSTAFWQISARAWAHPRRGNVLQLGSYPLIRHASRSATTCCARNVSPHLVLFIWFSHAVCCRELPATTPLSPGHPAKLLFALTMLGGGFAEAEK